MGFEGESECMGNQSLLVGPTRKAWLAARSQESTCDNSRASLGRGGEGMGGVAGSGQQNPCAVPVPFRSQADFLAEVAGAAGSARELVESQGAQDSQDSLLQSAGRNLRSREDERLLGAHGVTALDLALFESWPGLKALLDQSMPVIWLTQLALWPELMSSFLQMIRCISVHEDSEDGGEPMTVQRLRSHPDVECWQDEHMATAMVALTGLVVWCLGVPLALFLRIWALRDRQEPRNRRRFGYFIQGLEPSYWCLGCFGFYL